MWENFPNKGGGVSDPNPLLDVNLPTSEVLKHVTKRGEVISDQI